MTDEPIEQTPVGEAQKPDTGREESFREEMPRQFPRPYRQRCYFWPISILARILAGVGIALFSLLVAVLLFLLFPPCDLLRRAILPIAQQALHHQQIHIQRFDFSLLHYVDIEGLWLGPPAGFQKPLFTVKRIRLRYDLSKILKREIQVTEVLVERPILRVEAKEGKLNWMAFLEGLPPSKPKPKEESEPPDVRLTLGQFAIKRFGVEVDDGLRRLILESFNLKVKGSYSRTQSHLELDFGIKGPKPNQANLLVLQRGTPPLGGHFLTEFDLRIVADGLENLRAKIGMGFHLASKKIFSPWKLAPIDLALKLESHADLKQDKAWLDRFSLQFNQDELMRVAATLTGLNPPGQIELLLSRLYLPLNHFAPYLKPFLPDINVGGEISVEQFRVAGKVAELTQQKPLIIPSLSGNIHLKNIRAEIARRDGAAQVKNVNLNLAFSSRQPNQTLATDPRAILNSLPALLKAPSTEALIDTNRGAAPPLSVQGKLDIGLVRVPKAEVKNIQLHLAAGLALEELQPAGFGARLALNLPTISAAHPQLGPLQTGLKTQLQASGNLRQGTVSLDQFELQLEDLLSLQAKARAQELGKKHFTAELQLKPVDLAALLQRIPSPLRRQFGIQNLAVAGRLGLELKVQGKAPPPRTPVLRLPVELATRIRLENVSVKDKVRQLQLGQFQGDINISGKPTNLKIATQFNVGQLQKADLGVSAKNIGLPLTIHLTPKQIEAELGLSIEQLGKRDLGFSTRGLKLSSALKVALPLSSVLDGKSFAVGLANAQINYGWNKLQLVQPGNSIALGSFQGGLHCLYNPQHDPAIQVDLETRLASLQHAQQGAALKDLLLKLQTKISGPRLRLPLGPADLQLTSVGTKLQLGLGQFNMQKVLMQPLRNTSLTLAAALSPDGQVELQNLALRLPTHGASVDVAVKVPNALNFDPQSIPPFDITLRANIDRPTTTDPNKAHPLQPGLKIAGKAGIDLRVRRISKNRVQLDGRLLSRAFNVWTRGTAIEPQRDGGQIRKVSMIAVRDMNADIPISQQVILNLPRWSLPEPQHSIFDSQSASVLYSSLEPYGGSQSRLTIGGLTLDEQLTAINPAGKVLSTAQRRTSVDRLAMNLAIANSTLKLSRLYIKLFGGDIAGELQAQLLRLKPLDLRLGLKTQITGVNLGYLNPAVQKPTDETEVSALIDTKFWLSRQYVEGQVNITRLSLEMLDSLLAYLDPNKTNESVQNNRKLLKSWYTKWINPKVKLVSIWINHGNLNMDIDMDAWFVAGTLLKRTLNNMRIRRINILPFLPKNFAEQQP